MRYRTSKEFLDDDEKSVLVFGMSGVGKSHVANLLTQAGDWLTHSIDKRIGDLLQKHILADYAPKDWENVLDLLRNGDLSPIVKYLGKPGSQSLGGRSFASYRKRLKVHAQAEKFALVESPSVFDVFQSANQTQRNFLCDTGGSICEVLHILKDSSLLAAMSHRMLFVYIEAEEHYDDILVDRFVRDPKPMFYNDEFLVEKWKQYLSENDVSSSKVDPNEFAVWGFNELVKHRRPLYESIAKKWGVTVSASDISEVENSNDFLELVSNAIATKRSHPYSKDLQVGRVFAQRRRELQVTKKRLAEVIGVPESVITKIENSKLIPTDRLEQRLYQILYVNSLKPRPPISGKTRKSASMRLVEGLLEQN
ncbi:helix-turn-helix domain-containing protein [Octadecabacter ascidiaceicola]|uniref:Uncharacterized protein n=1 Tax=Octadecabacter ascidiaceicola TaxID=1655543 RepID=A0A238JLF6_9RHOB|nr:helix-turn-helix domain-containing protein [Octadecabacter ascidiaceicola]SMX31305.1 hypothetical protein OCA8868_00293 [Octadecabacter ascidiaceicola]